MTSRLFERLLNTVIGIGLFISYTFGTMTFEMAVVAILTVILMSIPFAYEGD